MEDRQLGPLDPVHSRTVGAAGVGDMACPYRTMWLRYLIVKTTVEIDDALVRVRKHARRTGQSMRSLVEEVLRIGASKQNALRQATDLPSSA
jgi:hypothetical protein